mmetsp:Transcript_11491/g.21760  ORF Transcript_11491/g.21760 Transcript_11491/m.21760 type:complete len:165 (+) Transcript_11491:566-1060(+)
MSTSDIYNRNKTTQQKRSTGWKLVWCLVGAPNFKNGSINRNGKLYQAQIERRIHLNAPHPFRNSLPQNSSREEDGGERNARGYPPPAAAQRSCNKEIAVRVEGQTFARVDDSGERSWSVIEAPLRTVTPTRQPAMEKREATSLGEGSAVAAARIKVGLTVSIDN